MEETVQRKESDYKGGGSLAARLVFSLDTLQLFSKVLI
jgi:hypothetical protein